MLTFLSSTALQSTETHLASHRVRRPLPVPHRGQHHQTPPEAVGETPPGGGLFLRKVNQTETAICELWGR